VDVFERVLPKTTAPNHSMLGSYLIYIDSAPYLEYTRAYPLDDAEIPVIPGIEFLFFGHFRRSIETPTLTYPGHMVSHMDLYYVPQRLVRCILAIFVALDVTPQWTQMANARDMPIGIRHFGMVLCSLIYHHPAHTNRHMGTLWGLLHHPNQKTGRAWRFS